MTAPAAFAIDIPAGMNGDAYSNSGSQGSPTWTLQGNIKDVDLGDAVTLYKNSLRKNRPFTTYVPTMREWNPKFKMAWYSSDPLAAALVAAANNGTAIDMVFLDGPVVPAMGNTSQGPRADWVPEGVPRSEHIEEGMEIEISLKIAETGNTPTWFTVTT